MQEVRALWRIDACLRATETWCSWIEGAIEFLQILRRKYMHRWQQHETALRGGDGHENLSP
jgi:hypothetical protein